MVRSVLALLLFPLTLFAQPAITVVSVPPKEPTKWVDLPKAGDAAFVAGTPIQLSTGETASNWLAIDDGLTLFPSADKKSITIGTPNGGKFRAIAIGPDGVPALFMLSFAGPVPPPFPQPPGPGPDPQPNPNPVPVGAVTKFVVVEDTSKAGAWRGDLLFSPKLATFMAQFAHGSTTPVHRLVDINDRESTDLLVKEFQNLAAGKALPWLFLLDSAGKVLKDVACPLTEDAFIAQFDLHVGERKLGLKVGMPKLKWKMFGSTPQTPIIPRSAWKEVSGKAFCPPVHDQDGRGQCASSMTAGMLELARNQVGLPYVKVSAGDLYARVNGGRDDGSLLEDNMAEIMNNGIAPASVVPYVWNGKRPDNSAAMKAQRDRFQVVDAYLCADFDAMASAIQLGFVVGHGMMWRDGFRVDADGWLVNPSGGQGGHAQMAYGTKQRNGQWGLITQNSWGLTWGGSKDGAIKAGSEVVPENLFGTQIGGYFALRTVKQTPADFPVGGKFGKLANESRPEFALAP